MEKRHQLAIALNEFLNEASEESLDVLAAALEGSKAFETKTAKTYINGMLDYKGEIVSETRYEAKMKVTPLVLNPLQITHGGILATFADTAMGTHVALKLPEDKASVTAELGIHYLKPAIGTTLLAVSDIIQMGRRLWVMECKIYNEEQKIVCSATGSFFVVPRPQ
jgi:uncharacterized protein (TIGR00369 family)